MIIASLILIMLAGASEGIMDSLQFHFEKTRFYKFKNQTFWDPKISWKNKWNGGDSSLGEKFKFSSTALVGFTDAWHLFKTIRNLGIFVSIPLALHFTESVVESISVTFALRLFYGIGFYITYK